MPSVREGIASCMRKGAVSARWEIFLEGFFLHCRRGWEEGICRLDRDIRRELEGDFSAEMMVIFWERVSIAERRWSFIEKGRGYQEGGIHSSCGREGLPAAEKGFEIDMFSFLNILIYSLLIHKYGFDCFLWMSRVTRLFWLNMFICNWCSVLFLSHSWSFSPVNCWILLRFWFWYLYWVSPDLPTCLDPMYWSWDTPSLVFFFFYSFIVFLKSLFSSFTSFTIWFFLGLRRCSSFLVSISFVFYMV